MSERTDRMPSYAEISRRVSALLLSRGEEWAGLPMPIPGLRLSIEPKNPWLDRITALQTIVHEPQPVVPPDDEDDGPWTVTNQWYSTRLAADVAIFTNGRRVLWSHGKWDYVRRFGFAFDTMRAANAWTIATETAAIEKLAELLEERPHLWEAYVLTGSFLETSARSGVTYLFRRCRPTVAFRDQRILCTLCLHPIGYYEETHAGSMCPTDDVIAHLLLMRADEPFYWRRANQHAPWRPESGL